MKPEAAARGRFSDSLPFGNVYTLHPGGVACGTRGDRLETLLGSCVAIVLTDPRRTTGAMCHIVHGRPAPADAPASAAYADVALHSMYEMLRGHGINPLMCEAFVYGGGNMFPTLMRDSHVGTSNARWALEALAADGVKVLTHDLGGNAYRRLAWTVGPDAPVVTAVAV